MRSFGAISARIYRLLNRNPESNRIVVDLLGLTPEDRALEVGCGPGAAIEHAAKRIGPDRVAAVEPSSTFVDMARKRVPGADIRIGSATDIPFDDGRFSVIWSIASMHHWPERDAGLAAQTAKLAPGGRLVVAERLLDKPGHGITPEQAADVVTYLEQLGHAHVRSFTRVNGKKTIQLIEATAPA
ncbi:MAG TPA: class I SAM-dependent methyltransferase [Jiangellaceae bacterium]|nr:class I SAM-dependent methyltransferase [Jiangellaceae bacterium]